MATPTNFSLTPIEGVDVTQTYAPVASVSNTNLDPSNPGLPFRPGARIVGVGGREFVFVTASGAIAVSNICGISQSTSTTASTPLYTAATLTKALADSGADLGVAVVAIADTYSGWLQTKGPTSLTVKNSCLPSVPLYTSASAGFLDDTSASQTRIYGIRIEKTATSSGAAKIAWIQNMAV